MRTPRRLDDLVLDFVPVFVLVQVQDQVQV